MSKVGKYINNGPMEDFWGILKRERCYGRRFFTSREQLVRMIQDYIVYYSFRRTQRGLGVRTPPMVAIPPAGCIENVGQAKISRVKYKLFHCLLDGVHTILSRTECGAPSRAALSTLDGQPRRFWSGTVSGGVEVTSGAVSSLSF